MLAASNDPSACHCSPDPEARPKIQISRWDRKGAPRNATERSQPLFQIGELSYRTALPLPVLRERAGVRVLCAGRAEDPHPNPLPEYREREPERAPPGYL